MKKPKVLLLTCEHAVNTIPDTYQPYFEQAKILLNSHRGIDFGAESIAIYLRQAFDCQLFTAKASRLLIDCNRSLHHKNCFSEISRYFTSIEKKKIINEYYQSYRKPIIEHLQSKINQGFQVVHLSIHSFAPILDDLVRYTEFGLLYDPKRPSEKALSHAWHRQFRQIENEWRIRLNYPYKGIADGFTTALRRDFNDTDYIGIEVESNQALMQNESLIQRASHLLEKSLKACLP